MLILLAALPERANASSAPKLASRFGRMAEWQRAAWHSLGARFAAFEPQHPDPAFETDYHNS
jgi:hypothetical protein